MKFDMGRAWTDAVAMLVGNRELLILVAGLFFFLPYFALMIFLPDDIIALQSAQEQVSSEKLGELMLGFYQSYWWVLLLIILAQGVGSLTLMALLGRPERPTIGDALGAAIKLFLPMVLAQIMVGLAVAVPFITAIAIAAGLKSPAIGVVLGLIAIIAGIYLWMKFSLALPTIAVEGEANPVAALRRSWHATRGNSLLLLAFFALLVLAMTIAGSVISMFTGMAFVLGSGHVATIGNGFVSALINAVYAAIMVAALVAAYRQLTGAKQEDDPSVFE